MGKIRLDKIINDCLLVGRKQAKTIIKDGRVSVNGAVVTNSDTKADPELDQICFDGETLFYQEFHYFVMNKPAGVLSATEDKSQRTIIDLLPDEVDKRKLFPVGRLDKDTTGLIFITDDGDFAHQMTSPKKDISKVYEAQVDGKLDENAIELFASGIVLKDGYRCKPAQLEIVDENHCRVTVTEGKYHQVKRMLASVGNPVISLKRVQIGDFRLDDSLKSGEFREISKNDLCIVMKAK